MDVSFPPTNHNIKRNAKSLDEIPPKKRDEVFTRLRKSLKELEVSTMDLRDFRVEPVYQPRCCGIMSGKIAEKYLSGCNNRNSEFEDKNRK